MKSRETKQKDLDALSQSLENSTSAMVVSFSNAAKIEQTFTDNKRMLRQKVELISPTNRSSDLSEALRAASGLASHSVPTRVPARPRERPDLERRELTRAARRWLNTPTIKRRPISSGPPATSRR